MYAIIDSPFLNITTGTLSAFTMDLKFRTNFAFYPRLDAFTRNIGRDDMEVKKPRLAVMGEDDGSDPDPVLLVGAKNKKGKPGPKRKWKLI